jgi:hypothetical protein
VSSMAEKKIKIIIDKDGNLSAKTDGFDHSTLESLEMLDALLEDIVDELPKEELTPEGRKSKAKLGTTVKKSSKQRIGRGE